MQEHNRIIQTEDLCVGSRFSQPLFFDDGRHIFLASEVPLTQRLLDSLHRWNSPYLITNGFEILVPMEDDIPELESVD